MDNPALMWVGAPTPRMDRLQQCLRTLSYPLAQGDNTLLKEGAVSPRVGLAFLDLHPSDDNALEKVAKLGAYPQLGVIVVGEKGDDDHGLAALEQGADDFLLMPMQPREVLARTRSVLRRCGVVWRQTRGIHHFGEWRFDPESRLLHSPRVGDIRLPAGESEILTLLLARRGQVVTRSELLGVVSGRSWDASVRTVDVLVGRLRRRLGDPPRHPRHIATVRGRGYQCMGAGSVPDVQPCLGSATESVHELQASQRRAG